MGELSCVIHFVPIFYGGIVLINVFAYTILEKWLAHCQTGLFYTVYQSFFA